MLFSCIAAILGADVILTDLPDRLRLLKKNLEVNFEEGNLRGSARASELTWGDELDNEFIEPLPDFSKHKLNGTDNLLWGIFRKNPLNFINYKRIPLYFQRYVITLITIENSHRQH